MIEFKRSGGDQIVIWIVVGLIGLLTLLFLVLGLIILAAGNAIALVLIIVALLFAGLAWYVYNEAAARGGTRIAIDGQTLHLHLRAHRGYVAQEKVDTSIPLSAIRVIEARAEAFRALGTTAIQFAYALVLTDHRRIVLGADRRFTQPFYQNAAKAISSQAQIPITNLGLVDGQAGFLLVAGQTTPGWDAAPVTREAMDKRFQDEGATWRIVSILAAAALAIGALVRALG